MGEFQFISTRNYMKKDQSSGTGTMQGPSTSKYFGNLYITQMVVNHNLGYTPLFRVYYEPYRDNRVMEAFQDNAWYLPETPNATRVNAIAPTCMTWADENNLYIELNFNSNSLSGYTYPVYWTIYKDYGLEV